MPTDPNALDDHQVGLLDAEDVAHTEIDLSAEEGGESVFGDGTFSKLASGIATLVACIVLSYVVPALRGDLRGVIVMVALLGALGLRIANRLRLRRGSRDRGSR